MSKKILECEYCKTIITENDTTCPKCGANCSNVIKKYHKELELEEKKKQEELEAKQKELSDKTKKAMKVAATGFGIHFVIATIIIIAVFVGFGIMAFSQVKKPRTKKAVEGALNEKVNTEKYAITLDSYETYEYYDDFFKNCNTKEGYQKVAFHFLIENTSEESISTSSIVYNVDVKAEDEVVYSSGLKADENFCNVIQGKKDYNKLPSTNLLAGDKVSGYLGYQIPKNKEKLKFVIDNSVVIEMTNPVYEETE
ncbi:MAG: DUF4352 domain-containing protein [Bacilli bacterium]|nr:DUF4352 domain-containing protein [Bacilli bacterium]